jgi:S-adenosyl methyltransferase
MSGNTHESAQSLAPDCRVVYVDNDPVVLAHARAKLTSAPGGAVVALDENPRYHDAVVTAAAGTLDLARPVAILLMATLSFVLDDAAAAEILQSLAGAVPAGSYVALYHQASDLNPAMRTATQRWNAMSGSHITIRSGRSSQRCWPASSRSRRASCPSPNGAPPQTTPASASPSPSMAR